MRGRRFVALISMLTCAMAHAQFISVTCPERILLKDPSAQCVVRNNFTFFVYGTMPIPTPSTGCKVVERIMFDAANLKLSCPYVNNKQSCICDDSPVDPRTFAIREDPESLSPICPANFDKLDERTAVTGADGYTTSLPICQARQPCPVKPLLPITDTEAQKHESGQYSKNPDLIHISDEVRTGALCIQQKQQGAKISSGFRPQMYQDHLQEVWDKWEILKPNKTEACREIRADVANHINQHQMRRRPGANSNHPSGKAVDISGIPEENAERVARDCGMYRPYADDRVHFQFRFMAAPK